MCGSMVDIQSATAENRWGKKKEREKHSSKIQCPHLLRRAAIVITIINHAHHQMWLNRLMQLTSQKHKH